MGITTTVVMQLVARVIVLCLAFPIHECAHAFVANKLGDPTAKNLGRINLNPFAHMRVLPAMLMMVLATLTDIFFQNASYGNFILLITSILFFRAVPINPMYFKNRKKGMALTGIAGPLSNIILGFIFLILLKVVAYFIPTNAITLQIAMLFQMVVLINLQLATFNLLPIPPMDGYRVLQLFISDRFSYKIEQYSTYIMIGVAVLLYATPIFDYVLLWGSRGLYVVIDFCSKFLDLIAGV